MSIKGSRSLAEALSASGALPGKKAGRGKKTRKQGLPVPRESEVVSACKLFLELNGALVIRNNSGGARIGKRLVRFGEPGSADLIACLGGRYVAVECKRPGGKLRPAQAAWLDSVRRAGGLTMVVRSVADLETALQLEGVLS